MYECHETKCEYKVKTLKEIKNHIRNTHEEGTFMHLKMSRKNFTEVDSKGYPVFTNSDED